MEKSNASTNKILTREFFRNKIEEIKNNRICFIPDGPINIIDKDAFLDWEKLEYLIIPPNVVEIHKEAFNWSKLKVVVTGCKLPDNISDAFFVLPFDNTNISLMHVLEESFKLNEKIDINSDKLDSKRESINQEIGKYLKELKQKEETLTKSLSKVTELTDLITRETTKDQVLCEEILTRIKEETKTAIKENLEELRLAKESLNKERNLLDTEVEKVSKKLEKTVDKKIADATGFSDKVIEKTKNRIEKEITKFDDISSDLKVAIENLTTKTDNLAESVANQALKRVQEKTPYKNLIINLSGVKQKKLSGSLFHERFEDVVKVLSLRLHPLLVGPAGSGKNVILEQAAKALDLKFHYVNDVTEEHKVMGFVDAQGNFQQTQFFKAFTEGGLIMIDEMDNSHPSALLAINAALGTGYHHYLTFPDGILYESNPNFYLAAAANTYGKGSDAIYCGRSSLDGASLNRFVPIFIDYDRNLEESLVHNNSVLKLFWSVRESINKNKIRHVVSTRNIVNADRMLESKMFSLEQIFEYSLIQSMSDDDLRMILNDLSNTSKDIMIANFIDYLSKDREISLNEYKNYTEISSEPEELEEYFDYDFGFGQGFPKQKRKYY